PPPPHLHIPRLTLLVSHHFSYNTSRHSLHALCNPSIQRPLAPSNPTSEVHSTTTSKKDVISQKVSHRSSPSTPSYVIILNDEADSPTSESNFEALKRISTSKLQTTVEICNCVIVKEWRPIREVAC
ncbi:hypothetical protein M758_3G049000, partial [Ceratodon purpureus]